MASGFRRLDRELSVSEILAETLSLYSSRFAELALPFLIAGLVTGILSAATLPLFLLDYSVVPRLDMEFTAQLFANIMRIVTAALFLSLAAWVVTTIVNGMIVKYTSDILEKGDADYSTALNETISRLPALLVASFLIFILALMGVIAFVVPGVILLVMFSLFIPVIMIENLGALESLGRSRRLVANRWGKTFILLLIIVAIVGLATLIVDALLASVIPDPIRTIFTNIVSSLLAPVYVIAITLLYYSMTAREVSAL